MKAEAELLSEEIKNTFRIVLSFRVIILVPATFSEKYIHFLICSEIIKNAKMASTPNSLNL